MCGTDIWTYVKDGEMRALHTMRIQATVECGLAANAHPYNSSALGLNDNNLRYREHEADMKQHLLGGYGYTTSSNWAPNMVFL